MYGRSYIVFIYPDFVFLGLTSTAARDNFRFESKMVDDCVGVAFLFTPRVRPRNLVFFAEILVVQPACNGTVNNLSVLSPLIKSETHLSGLTSRSRSLQRSSISLRPRECCCLSTLISVKSSAKALTLCSASSWLSCVFSCEQRG